MDTSTTAIAINHPIIPSWTLPDPTVELLFEDPKAQLSAIEIQSLFSEYKAKHENFVFFFTDGSKSVDTVGAAFWGPSQKNFRLPDFCSVYTAELFAINQVVHHIEEEGIVSSVICSDSKSSLMSIRDTSTSNNIIYDIHQTLLSASAKYISIRFLWIPGHMNITGNSRADELARSGSTLDAITTSAATVEEAIRVVTLNIANHAQMKWDGDVNGRHMHSIKPTRGNWFSCFQPSEGSEEAVRSRQREVVLARLRLGHTLLTHKHLFNSEQSAPTCDRCQAPLTVKHILLECHKFTQFRVPMEQYATSIQSSLSLALLLGDDHPTLTKLLFKFLDKAKLTTSI